MTETYTEKDNGDFDEEQLKFTESPIHQIRKQHAVDATKYKMYHSIEGDSEKLFSFSVNLFANGQYTSQSTLLCLEIM